MSTKEADYLDEKTIDGLNAEEPSTRALADGIKLILRKLWSREDLEELIDKRHNQLCENCPLRSQPVPVQQQPEEPEPLTRRHVVMAVIKAPWLWIIVATVCAIFAAKYGISVPSVGGVQQ